MPTYINGNDSGFMIEACAGILDENNPVEEIKRDILNGKLTFEEVFYWNTEINIMIG